MKSAHIPSPDPSQNRSFPQPSLLRWLACAIITLVAALLAVPSAHAQGIRFQFQQVRVTVPVNSTTTSVISNSPNSNPTVVLVNGVTNAIFDISGLPANTSATLTDTNGNVLPSIDQSTNVLITVNTTNLPEGTYTFNLNASGTDTNGVPVTNTFPFVLQSAYIWNGGGFNVSNNWAAAASWVGGVVPGSTDDAVFGDSGAQTNVAFTNMGVDINTTIGSMRFAQSTNGGVYNIKIGSGATLAVTGTNGFSLLRDQIGEFGLGNNAMIVNFINTNAGTVLVSNANANFGILLPNGVNPTLNFSNLATLVTYVSRMGLSDFQIYPNYRALNDGYNGGRNVDNYSGIPRQFWSSTVLARTNFITALYADPNNYTNEVRGYSLMFDNSEQQGDGSGTPTAIFLGTTNIFNVDSICFVGANSSASGVNNAGVKFQRNGSGAIFRGTNGGRMSVFAISDDGGTNQANSNLKATIDFSGPTNSVSILADRFYIARDRTMVKSNQSPNVQGDFTMGAGTVDVNTCVLGFQEHSNKVDWSLLGYPPYLNYCEGRIIVTNSGTAVNLGGTFKVNGNLTLGYTADRNQVGSAQQFNTFGRITIYTNATVIASNIICDGGLNFYDSNGRQNQITINQGGNLVISNTCGFPNDGAADFSAADPNGMRLETLTIAAGKVTLPLDPSRTNIFVRTLQTPGLIPGIIKVASLTGVTSFPVQIPVISYVGSAAPFLNADVSALGAGYFGYILNNDANKTVDVYITTNAPNNLVWTGAAGNSQWDTTSLNWALIGTATPTNFNLGDLVTFNDSSSFNSISIAGSVVPGQTGVGVTISNITKSYTFSSGIIAGTALIVKQGTGSLQFDSAEQGPISIFGGNITGGSGGSLGTVTIASNVVLNFSGSVNGGLTSTGTVFYTGSSFNGPISIQGGFLDNSGKIFTTVGQVITMASGTVITNESNGEINLGVGIGNGTSWTVPAGSILANFGQINLFQPRITIDGLFLGNGTVNNPNNGGLDITANATRLLINQDGTMGIGSTVAGSVSSMNIFSRFDFNNDPTATSGGGMSTIWIDFDFANAQINDIMNCDRWNNDTGLLLFTNINPSAGTFTNGQVITIFHNSNGTGTNNNIDTAGFSPLIQPYVPGPGLVWGVTNFNTFGTVAVTTNAMVWDGASSANWSTNISADTSWKANQTFQPNQGAFFGDNANGATTVNITTAVMPAGERGTLLNSNQPNVFPGITVSNALKDYVFTSSGTQTGKITGITGIYKTGPGTLFLLTTNANDYSGDTIIEGGTLAVTNLPNGAAAIASLGSVTYGQMKNQVIMDGGTLAYIGTTNVQLGHHVVLQSHNGTVQVTSATNLFLINNNVVGPGGLTKTGPGILAMNSGNNNYQAGTTVNGGTLRLFATSLGSGGLTMADNTALELTNNFTLTNALNFTGNPVQVRTLTTSTNILSGPWTGGGSVTFSNLYPLVFNGSMSAFSGTVSFGATSANYRFNNGTNRNDCTGSALASFDLGTGSSTLSNLNGAGLTYDLGALSGGPNTILAGRSSNSVATVPLTTYSIGANGNDSTFSGKIANGQDTLSVVKVGTGQLLLNGISTYTGSTTVSNGILGGAGSIASALTVTTNTILSPGASFHSIGTFTVSNNVTLNGTVLMELTGSTGDQLAATGTLTANGTLLVSNIGPDIVNGTVFHLFNKGVTGFALTILPTNNPATAGTYSWQDNLAADGTIKLLDGGTNSVSLNPTNITVSASGNTLTLTWPGDHLGWQLLSNSVDLTLSNFWFPVAGSTTTTQQNLTIDLSQTNVFFRMVYPPLP